MWKNKIKTAFLLATLGGLFMLIGGLVGGSTGITIAFIMAMVINGLTYFFSDKIVLKLYGAQPLDEQRHAPLVGIVRELSDKMNIPMPKLWIINTPVANAFATGRNPEHSSIAVTTGILEILELHELRGVLAHEMSHIYNRDILVGTIAATLATAIGYLAHMVQNMLFWSSISNNSKNKNSANPIGLLLVAILMPIAATIIQLSVSRSREYLADETGAHACNDPLALASALRKLHNNVRHAHFNPDNTAQTSSASLFIVYPFLSGKGLLELFATHPPLEKRIEKLEKLSLRSL
jgi:heat shock protein HtpX